MEYKFTGDVTGATAALQELKARLADINRDSMKFAREAAKGDADARQSLLQRVAASDQLKAKVRDLTGEVQRFQKASEQAQSSGWFTKPNMQQISGAMTGLAFGIDDFVQQWANTGKLSEGIRGAGNNLTMLAALWGPIPVVATAAATAAATFFTRSFEKSDQATKKLEEYKKKFEELSKVEARGRGVTEDRQKLLDAGAFRLAAEKKVKEAERGVFLERQNFEVGGGALLGQEMENLAKAKEEARVAREAEEILRKEIATKDAEHTFGGAKEGLKRVYEDVLIKGGTPEEARAAMRAKAQQFGTPEQAEGIAGFADKIAEEVQGGLTGKAAARGLQDPAIARKEEAEAKVLQQEAALHAREQAADAERRGMNRRHITRDAKNEIEGLKDLVQNSRDQLKALNQLIDEQKKTREDKLSKVIVPKGIGDAGK
jgi:hypothetical protein